jgi:hypothetical protein
MDRLKMKYPPRPAMARGAAATSRGPEPPELAAETGHVMQDRPLFLTAPLCRRGHLRRGRHRSRRAAPLPGGHPSCQQPNTVPPGRSRLPLRPAWSWPWLVHAGCLRAGFCSAMPAAHPVPRSGCRRVVPGGLAVVFLDQ